MKKVKEFVKDNWLFLLFVIPFIFICVSNKTPDNDIWFLLNNGRYVFNHGIPYYDPFTIHEGLKYIMQQWLTSSIFWGLFNSFGYRSLLVFIYIMSFIFMFIFYKLCYVVSEKKKISIIVTSIVFCLIYEYVVIRPQIISYVILMLEILLVELYIKKKNTKYLYPLPVLSIVLINVHAAMWYFQFVFLLPFILNGINYDKIKFIKKIKIDKYKLKPILIVALIMFVVGFINPYGYEAITYIFKSYGLSRLNEIVGEMNPMSWDSYNGKVIFIYIILFMILNYVRKDLKLDIRHFLFICGMTLLGFMHNKCYPLFVLVVTYALMYNVRKLDICFDFLDNKFIKSLKRGLSFGLGIALIATFGYTIYYSYNMYYFSEKYKMENTINYIIDNYNKDDVILYVGFNTGGYAEYRGLKPYIDPRAELFFKKFNGKEDIFVEAFSIESDINFDFDKFVKKYDFTHIIVYNFSYFKMYLDDCEDYELVFTDELPNNDENLSLMLYVKKNLEILE